MVKKKRAITVNGFNVLAVFIVLLILPFSTAFISNGMFFKRTYDDYESLLQDDLKYPYTPATNPNYDNTSILHGSYWYNNGNGNYTGYYENLGTYSNEDDLECLNIINGVCQGSLGFGASSFTQNWRGDQYPSYTDSENRVFWTFPKTHAVWGSSTVGGTYTPNNISNADYIGTSGHSGFDIVMPKILQSVDKTQSLDGLKFHFIDNQVIHNCNTHIWDNGTYEATVQFRWFDSSTNQYIYSQSFTKEFDYDNKYKWTRNIGTGWNTDCYHGTQFEFDFDYIESYNIKSISPNGLNDVETILSIDRICKYDSVLNKCVLDGFVELGFNGVDNFMISVEKQTLDQTAVDTSVRFGTTLLSIIIVVVAIASTDFWNPFKRWLGGVKRAG